MTKSLELMQGTLQQIKGGERERYYKAALLEALLQWFDPSTRFSWEIEQREITEPLAEWAMSVGFSRSFTSSNLILQTLVVVWHTTYFPLVYLLSHGPYLVSTFL